MRSRRSIPEVLLRSSRLRQTKQISASGLLAPSPVLGTPRSRFADHPDIPAPTLSQYPVFVWHSWLAWGMASDSLLVLSALDMFGSPTEAPVPQKRKTLKESVTDTSTTDPGEGAGRFMVAATGHSTPTSSGSHLRALIRDPGDAPAGYSLQSSQEMPSDHPQAQIQAVAPIKSRSQPARAVEAPPPQAQDAGIQHQFRSAKRRVAAFSSSESGGSASPSSSHSDCLPSAETVGLQPLPARNSQHTAASSGPSTSGSAHGGENQPIGRKDQVHTTAAGARLGSRVPARLPHGRAASRALTYDFVPDSGVSPTSPAFFDPEAIGNGDSPGVVAFSPTQPFTAASAYGAAPPSPAAKALGLGSQIQGRMRAPPALPVAGTSTATPQARVAQIAAKFESQSRKTAAQTSRKPADRGASDSPSRASIACFARRESASTVGLPSHGSRRTLDDAEPRIALSALGAYMLQPPVVIRRRHAIPVSAVADLRTADGRLRARLRQLEKLCWYQRAEALSLWQRHALAMRWYTEQAQMLRRLGIDLTAGAGEARHGASEDVDSVAPTARLHRALLRDGGVRGPAAGLGAIVAEEDGPREAAAGAGAAADADAAADMAAVVRSVTGRQEASAARRTEIGLEIVKSGVAATRPSGRASLHIGRRAGDDYWAALALLARAEHGRAARETARRTRGDIAAARAGDTSFGGYGGRGGSSSESNSGSASHVGNELSRQSLQAHGHRHGAFARRRIQLSVKEVEAEAAEREARTELLSALWEIAAPPEVTVQFERGTLGLEFQDARAIRGGRGDVIGGTTGVPGGIASKTEESGLGAAPERRPEGQRGIRATLAGDPWGADVIGMSGYGLVVVGVASPAVAELSSSRLAAVAGDAAGQGRHAGTDYAGGASGRLGGPGSGASGGASRAQAFEHNLQAAADGRLWMRLRPGMVVTRVNDRHVLGESAAVVSRLISTAPRPMRVTFQVPLLQELQRRQRALSGRLLALRLQLETERVAERRQRTADEAELDSLDRRVELLAGTVRSLIAAVKWERSRADSATTQLRAQLSLLRGISVRGEQRFGAGFVGFLQAEQTRAASHRTRRRWGVGLAAAAAAASARRAPATGPAAAVGAAALLLRARSSGAMLSAASAAAAAQQQAAPSPPSRRSPSFSPPTSRVPGLHSGIRSQSDASTAKLARLLGRSESKIRLLTGPASPASSADYAMSPSASRRGSIVGTERGLTDELAHARSALAASRSQVASLRAQLRALQAATGVEGSDTDTPEQADGPVPSLPPLRDALPPPSPPPRGRASSSNSSSSLAEPRRRSLMQNLLGALRGRGPDGRASGTRQPSVVSVDAPLASSMPEALKQIPIHTADVTSTPEIAGEASDHPASGQSTRRSSRSSTPLPVISEAPGSATSSMLTRRGSAAVSELAQLIKRRHDSARSQATESRLRLMQQASAKAVSVARAAMGQVTALRGELERERRLTAALQRALDVQRRVTDAAEPEAVVQELRQVLGRMPGQIGFTKRSARAAARASARQQWREDVLSSVDDLLKQEADRSAALGVTEAVAKAMASPASLRKRRLLAKGAGGNGLRAPPVSSSAAHADSGTVSHGRSDLVSAADTGASLASGTEAIHDPELGQQPGEDHEDDDAAAEAGAALAVCDDLARIPVQVLDALPDAAAALALQGASVVKQGALFKCSRAAGAARPVAWKKRYLRMGAGLLQYFVASASREASGSVSLERITAVAALPTPSQAVKRGRFGPAAAVSDRRRSSSAGSAMLQSRGTFSTAMAVLRDPEASGGATGCSGKQMEEAAASLATRANKGFPFWVQTPDKDLFFAVETAPERADWVVLLRAVMQHLHSTKQRLSAFAM